MTEVSDQQRGTEAASASNRSARKTRTGEVISSGMNKTIVVRTVTRVPHAKFGKIVKQMRKFYAHDERGDAKIGDIVRIIECRPMSKLKRWRLGEIVRKAVQVGVEPGALDVPAEAAHTRKKKEEK